MTSREEGFLLLSCHFGNPDRKILTTAQLRTLAARVTGRDWTVRPGDLTWQDIAALGYDTGFSQRIVGLLGETDLLRRYLIRGEKTGCVPITRVSPDYPPLLRQRLGLDSPGCLWAKGNLDILHTPGIALVGSRDLKDRNREFAAAVGRYAAEKGFALVSGNARGADRTAQEACLAAGGQVISFVADELSSHPKRESILYLSESGFEEPFTSQRALSRNRCIHALGQMVFVAQAELERGGTWDGTVKNLRFGWSPVLCFRDGSLASRELEQMGAYLIGREDLEDFSGVTDIQLTFFGA